MGTRRYDPVLYEQFVNGYGERLLRAPAIRPNPSVRYWPEVDDYTMSAGFARTPGGRMWLSWFGGEDSGEAVMLAAYSDDGGKTFSPPQFVIDEGCVEGMTHLGTVVGNLWTDPSGRLWWFFTMSLGYFDGRAGIWAAVCDNPDDGQPAWSVPRRLWHGCLLNKPIVARDGAWLLPAYLWPRTKIGIGESYWPGAESGLYRELDAERKTWIFASADRGATWTRRGGVTPTRANTFDEPMLVERRDGSFWMLLRTDEGTVQTESFDQCATWSEPKPFRQPNASSRFLLLKLASGNLLFVFNANPDPAKTTARSHMAAILSRDDGKTWEGGLVLDTRSPVSYPDGYQAPDGRIFVQHDYKRRHGELVLSVFREEDVLAGRDVSGAVALRHPMVQSRSMRENPDA